MGSTISVGQGEYVGQDNAVIQRAIDAASGAGGGIVEVPAGLYMLHDAVHLRDNVQLVGESGTVFRKVPSICSPLTNVIGFGHYEFTVADPEKFEVGMGVFITDNLAKGFYTTTGTIVSCEGSTLLINTPANHDYSPLHGGCVTSVFSLIDGLFVRNVEIKNLALDGNSEETRHINGCRGGGVFLLQAHNARIEEVEVSHFYGDAISFQQCTKVTVQNCYLHDNFGGGIHPGSGSVRYVLRENRIENNGGCGIFYCLRTTHSLCEGNSINGNKLDGISVGERDTDHILRHNFINQNHKSGIGFRKPQVQSGDRVWIEGNRLSGNGIDGASPEIIIPEGLHDICLINNAIEPINVESIHIEKGCTNISVVGNEIGGRCQKKNDIAGDSSTVSFKAPEAFPAVGPEAVKPHTARHLGVELTVI
jgi:hypothetical protein